MPSCGCLLAKRNEKVHGWSACLRNSWSTVQTTSPTTIVRGLCTVIVHVGVDKHRPRLQFPSKNPRFRIDPSNWARQTGDELR